MKSPIKYPSGQTHTEVYVPMGPARLQQRWCHQMIDEFREQDDEISSFNADFYKRRLLKEFYRKEYYENQGWDFTFRMLHITVVEIGPWARTYHAWIGNGQKVTIKLEKASA